MEITQTISEATQEIFSSMVMLDTVAGNPFERQGEPLHDGISATIALEGEPSGLLALHMSTQVAIEITNYFLDIHLNEMDGDVHDSIGEITNMLAGSIKSALDPSGSNIQLSIPTCTYGDEYTIDVLPNTKNVTIPFYLDCGDFLVELQLSC